MVSLHDAALCEREGANPGLQQRHVFEDIARPMVEADRTVLFLVDAMRFEMATELVEMPGTVAAARASPKSA